MEYIVYASAEISPEHLVRDENGEARLFANWDEAKNYCDDNLLNPYTIVDTFPIQP